VPGFFFVIGEFFPCNWCDLKLDKLLVCGAGLFPGWGLLAFFPPVKVLFHFQDTPAPDRPPEAPDQEKFGQVLAELDF